MKPETSPRKRAFLGEEFLIEMSNGTRQNQATGVRVIPYGSGKLSIKRIPEHIARMI